LLVRFSLPGRTPPSPALSPGRSSWKVFLQIRISQWLRRLITRSIAILPAVLVIGIAGEGKVPSLMILSQVVLSFQLLFAIIPLIQFTGDRNKMGEFTNSRLTSVIAWVVAAAILCFNAELLWLIFRGQ
jgi:manganese transport protein